MAVSYVDALKRGDGGPCDEKHMDDEAHEVADENDYIDPLADYFSDAMADLYGEVHERLQQDGLLTHGKINEFLDLLYTCITWAKMEVMSDSSDEEDEEVGEFYHDY